MIILWSILVLAGFGIIFGLGLAVASKIFHVEVDTRIEDITKILPNAKSGLFNIVVEEILVINSGSDVTPANKIPPINAPPILVCLSNSSTQDEMRMDDTTTMIDKTKYCNNNTPI